MMEQAHAAMDLPQEGALGPVAGEWRMGEGCHLEWVAVSEEVAASDVA